MLFSQKLFFVPILVTVWNPTLADLDVDTLYKKLNQSTSSIID